MHSAIIEDSGDKENGILHASWLRNKDLCGTTKCLKTEVTEHFLMRLLKLPYRFRLNQLTVQTEENKKTKLAFTLKKIICILPALTLFQAGFVI